MDVLVTYDISTTMPEGERRLAHIAKVCESYGTRVQYSVFECRVTETMWVQLLVDLADAIDPREDSVNIYRFQGEIAQRRFSIGRRPPRDPGQPWIV